MLDLTTENSPLIIGSRTFQSRLLVGTGKYKDMQETDLAIQASGAEIVTVAIRRVNIGQNPDQPNLLSVIPPEKYTILPNTAGCFDANSAVRTCMLARELWTDTTWSNLRFWVMKNPVPECDRNTRSSTYAY